jgi:hypothetical protein
MEKNADYKLSFTGTTLDICEKVGLFWNYSTPRIWNEEEVLWIPIQKGEFTVELVVDSKMKKVQLYYNRNLEKELEYVPADLRSIYLVMQNASITLNHILITKLY